MSEEPRQVCSVTTKYQKRLKRDVMSKAFSIQSEVGEGRATLIFVDTPEAQQRAEALADSFKHKSRIIIIQVTRFSMKEWGDALEEIFQSLSLKGVSLVAFGRSALVGQYLALTRPRVVRSVVFVDGEFPVKNAEKGGFVKWMDKRLPLGLPFVQGNDSEEISRGFSAEAFFQRVRCPALVLHGAHRPGSVNSNVLRKMLEAIPTSWSVELSDSADTAELIDLIQDFQAVPARCPQKNISRANS